MQNEKIMTNSINFSFFRLAYLAKLLYLCTHFSNTMAEYQIYTLIPISIVIVWALVVKLIKKDWANSVFMLITGATLLANGYAVYHMMYDQEVPMWILLVQLILSPTVVPQAYAYFCRQIGTKGSIGIHITLWSLLIFLLVPSLCIDIHPFHEPTMCEPLRFMHFNVFNHGILLYSISIPSLIILIQAVVTCARIPVVTKSLRIYELKFTTGGKTFIIWWILAIVFCVISSLIEMDTLRQPAYSWTYYIAYTFLIILIFGRIAMGLDLHPLQNAEEQEVENLDAFIEANKELADRARRLFMEEKLYLRQGLVTDDVVAMLGTNRTYFTRMMRAEFNMSFNEFVTSERIAYSKQLLTSSDKTIDEVAVDSGFSNASSYCRVFKRLTNTTPDAWRKDHQIEPDQA